MSSQHDARVSLEIVVKYIGRILKQQWTVSQAFPGTELGHGV